MSSGWRIARPKDFWSGLLFLIIGVGFAVGSREYSFGVSARPGPGYFPFGLGVLMALLGLYVLATSVGRKSAAGPKVGAFAWRPILVILGAILLFGFALPRFGMVVALPLLIIISSAASTEFSWKAAVLNSVILTVGSYLIFIAGLGLVIPVWPEFMTN